MHTGLCPLEVRLLPQVTRQVRDVHTAFSLLMHPTVRRVIIGVICTHVSKEDRQTDRDEQRHKEKNNQVFDYIFFPTTAEPCLNPFLDAFSHLTRRRADGSQLQKRAEQTDCTAQDPSSPKRYALRSPTSIVSQADAPMNKLKTKT